MTDFACQGIEEVLIIDCGPYVEIDVNEVVSFHREHDKTVTRALTDDGPLDLWVLDLSHFNPGEDLRRLLREASPTYYELRGYVNRLRGPQDFRRLVIDSFTTRCRLRPYGMEVRSRVWMADGALIDRGARIVGPAFIGHGVRIAGECLITRGTNVESNSFVDFGTAVEDSSILSNTYLGIGVDLSHSVVKGDRLFNLHYDVNLDITDPVVLRENISRADEPSRLEFKNEMGSSSKPVRP